MESIAFINDTETMEFVRSKAPEVIYCFGWSRLIGKELLSLPKYGVIGFHPAAIPYNRGRHPLIWALALGLNKTASTFFVMDEGADTGDIISQKEIIIDYEDDAQSLYEKVLQTAKDQVIEFTNQISDGSLSRTPQDPECGNTWRKRSRMDGQIDWRMSCGGIYNLVRALTHPYVGAHYVGAHFMYGFWNLELEPAGVDKYETGELISKFKGVFEEVKPELLLIPYRFDVHSDHRVIFDAVYSCTKSFRAPYLKTVLSMEIISETDQAQQESGFVPNIFINIDGYVERKIEIMKKYKSEIDTAPFPRNENAIKGLASYRGATGYYNNCEAFCLVKSRID